MVIVAIWSFGKGTIARYSRDELEVGNAKRVFFRIPWDEILEVQKVKRNGHQIITSQGTAVIAWPPLVLDKKGYAFFLRATLNAMATGNLRGDFYRIPMPVKLEEGHRYEYVNRRDTEQWMMFFILWFVPITFPVGIYKAIQHHNFMDGLTACSMWVIWFFALDKYRTLRRETRHVGIEVRDGRLHVTRPASSADVLNQYADGKLVPCMNPTPLDGAERFGSGNETVKIDRRFLRDVTP